MSPGWRGAKPATRRYGFRYGPRRIQVRLRRPCRVQPPAGCNPAWSALAGVWLLKLVIIGHQAAGVHLILNRIRNRVNYVLPSGDGFHPRMVRLKGTKAGDQLIFQRPQAVKGPVVKILLPQLVP